MKHDSNLQAALTIAAAAVGRSISPSPCRLPFDPIVVHIFDHLPNFWMARTTHQALSPSPGQKEFRRRALGSDLTQLSARHCWKAA